MSPDLSPEDRRRANYEIAEAIAPSWERRSADIEQFSAPVREWMLHELAPQPGQVVLELAAGAGETGFEAAKLVGERGRLISTDFSPAMLASARRRGAELGIENVEYRVVDGERIELEADSIDGVLCRFGLMLMVDPAAALAETHRVLRRGGRLTLAVWAHPQRNPYFTVIVGALVAGGLMSPPDPDGPGPFSLADPARLTALLEEAGFETVSTAEVPVHFAVPDVDGYLDLVADTAGPIGLTVQGLSAADREVVRNAADAALEPFRDAAGLELPGAALCAVAS
jgi:SAM-dependent methyltransferase